MPIITESLTRPAATRSDPVTTQEQFLQAQQQNAALGDQYRIRSQYAAMNQQWAGSQNDLIEVQRAQAQNQQNLAQWFSSPWTGIISSTGIMGGIVGRGKRWATLSAHKAFALVRRCFHHQTKESVQSKLNAAASLASEAKQNGQQALYEEMAERLKHESVSTRLVEAGFCIYLDRKAVERFAGRAATDVEMLHLTDITNFGRPIPKEVAVKLRQAKTTGLFSGFQVLHAGVAMIKTAAQKIHEKDPILFGVVAEQPERLYFIADWIDELCHLTLSELLTDPEFTGSLESVDVDRDAVVAEASERERLLATTNTHTWRTNEEKAKALANSTGKSWFKNIFRKKP